jgi:hypothetical protein
MVLARAVVNENGISLISEDSELTDALIERIREMNVQSVSVVGQPKPPEMRQQLRSEIKERFRKVAVDPYMDIIKQAVIVHIERI